MTRPADYQSRAGLLQDKVVLVTGASDGIGRAAALVYAGLGASVILHGRNVAKLEALYDEIEHAGGAQPAIVPLDLKTAQSTDYSTLRDTIEEAFGHLDGLLHSAGILGERRPIESAAVDAWREVLEVNVTAPMALTQALLPLLQVAANASVIFTSSGVGRKGRAFWGAYAVSKFATEGLMQVLADELENTSNIRVNSLNPGATNTAMRRSAYPAEKPTDNPDPADIMAAYCYLMGEDSVGVTGQAFNAQG